MDRLGEATLALSKLELQLTKDVDATRHKLIQSQGMERDDEVNGTAVGGSSSPPSTLPPSALSSPLTSTTSIVIPTRVQLLRDARRRSGGSPVQAQPPVATTALAETEDF